MHSGMAAARNAALGTVAGMGVVLWAGAAAADSDSDSDSVHPAELCEAAVDRAAGAYSRCLLSTAARFARAGNESHQTAARGRCADRFDARVERAVWRYRPENCTHSSLVEAIGDRTVAYAESVALEAGGTPVLELLFVQSSDGATLTDSTLVLSGVSEQTGWFSDRPHRRSGQEGTEAFVARWTADGPDSFAVDAPNADFTCEVDGEVVNQVVTLTEPVLAEDGSLSYAVSRINLPPFGVGAAPDLVICDADAHLFIDSSVESAGTACSPGYHPATYSCFVGGLCSIYGPDIPETACVNTLTREPVTCPAGHNPFFDDTKASSGCDATQSSSDQWDSGVSVGPAVFTPPPAAAPYSVCSEEAAATIKCAID